MFIPIIFNTEFMDYDSRKVWYLKNLFHCRKNNWPLITHEYLKTHFNEIVEGVDSRFFEEFEMEPLDVSELADVEQYFVPDAIFDAIQDRFDSRTEMLTYLYTRSDPNLQCFLKECIDSIQTNAAGTKVDGILHCLQPFTTIKELSKSYDAPLISYVFSAIRKVHGYRETLYCANLSDGIFCSDQCERRYQSFIGEKVAFPVLERRELIALLGKPRTFPLIPLLDAEPLHEVCICSEAYSTTPQIFINAPYTDEDLFYECRNLFPTDRIINRQHPYKLDQLKICRSEVKHDPATTILSSRRIASVSSQIVLKAMLWNRTVVMKKNTLPLSFACEKEMDSCKTVDLVFLNYYLFCYLVPSDLMFDQSYWRWRLTSPAESEIYKKHLVYYLNKFSLSRDVFEGPASDQRFQLLLRGRGCDEETVSNLSFASAPEKFCYINAVSKLRIEWPNSHQDQWCLNEFDGSEYTSHFTFPLEREPVGVYFYPLEDKAGFVALKKIEATIDTESRELFTSNDAPYRFINQNNGRLPIDSNFGKGRIKIEVTWTYQNIQNHLKENYEPK